MTSHKQERKLENCRDETSLSQMKETKIRMTLNKSPVMRLVRAVSLQWQTCAQLAMTGREPPASLSDFCLSLPASSKMPSAFSGNSIMFRVPNPEPKFQ